MEYINYIIIPVSGAVIGYFTNWLAIKMLFRPHNEIRLWGVRLPFTPGIIPKEKHRLAKKVGETVSGHLLTRESLADAVTSAQTLMRIEQALEELLADGEDPLDTALASFFGGAADDVVLAAWRQAMEAVKGLMPRLGTLIDQNLADNPELRLEIKNITDKIVDEHVGTLAGLFINRDKLADSVVRGVRKYISDERHMAEFSGKLDEWGRVFLMEKRRGAMAAMSAETLDNVKAALFKSIVFALEKGAVHIASAVPVGRIVEEQINAFGMDEGEKIVLSVLKRELNAITTLGGVLGFVIGLLTLLLRTCF